MSNVYLYLPGVILDSVLKSGMAELRVAHGVASAGCCFLVWISAR